MNEAPLNGTAVQSIAHQIAGRGVGGPPASEQEMFLRGARRWADDRLIGLHGDALSILEIRDEVCAALIGAGFKSADAIREADGIAEVIERKDRQRAAAQVDLGNGSDPEDEQGAKPYPLLDFNAIRDLPPVETIVDGLLQVGEMSCIAGAAGDGKSLFVLLLLFVIATGREFMGRRVEQGAVVYLAAEGMSGIPQRLRALQQFLGDFSLPPFFVIDADPQLLRDTARVIATLKQVPGGVRVLAIDTKSATSAGTDENSAKDTTAYLYALQRIQREVGCHVILIHHSGWGSDRERGHTSLRAGMSTMMHVTKDDSRVRVTCLKQRDLAPFDDMYFEIRPIGESAVLAPLTQSEVQARPDVLPESRRKALETLRTVGGNDGLAYSKWSEPTALAKSTFTRCVADLDRWGLIEKRGGKWAAL